VENVTFSRNLPYVIGVPEQLKDSTTTERNWLRAWWRGEGRICYTDTDTDTLLKIQATNVQESMTIDNTMTHCIPRKISKRYKLKMDQLTKDRLKTSRLH